MERICSNSGDTGRTLYKLLEANGNAAFFQVAVGLIPVLMFGGAVAELRNRPRQRPNPRPFGLALTAILAAGVIAEIIAIRGAIDPSVGDLGQRYLALVVTTGTVGLALWIAAPLLREATVGTRVWLGLREVVAVIGLAAVIGQVAITESLDHASARAALESAGERVTKVGRELNQAERTESAARTQLLHLAQSMRSTHAMSAVILHLHQLDDRALAPVRTQGPQSGQRRTSHPNQLSETKRDQPQSRTCLQGPDRGPESSGSGTAAIGRATPDHRSSSSDRRTRRACLC